MHGIHTGVGLGGEDQGGRVAGSFFDVMVGRIGGQPGEVLRLLGRAVFGDPKARYLQQVVAEHVGQRHTADSRFEQVRPLRDCRGHQQAAIRAARNR